MNGGGFAGVIQTLFPDDKAREYAEYMDRAPWRGKCPCHEDTSVGAACINRLMRLRHV